MVTVVSSGNCEWYTPSAYVEAARDVMGTIFLDPASSDVAQRLVRAENYFTAEQDGLAQDWCGRVWLNPPYNRGVVDRFAAKLLAELASGRVTEAVWLSNASTSSKWFQALLARADALCLPSKRIRFYTPDGSSPGSPGHSQAFVYFGPKAERFAQVFGQFGIVLPLGGRQKAAE